METRPGGSLPRWQQYDIRLNQEDPTKQVGLRTPEGKSFRFNDEETIEWVQYKGDERIGIIVYPDGSKILLENWLNAQKGVNFLREDLRAKITNELS